MSDVIVLDYCNPAVRHLCKTDKRLGKIIHKIGPISYAPYNEDPYPFIVHEIIEQMMSKKAGQCIYNRLSVLCGGRINVDSISALDDEQLRSAGMSNAKVQYIRNATEAIKTGKWDFDEMRRMPDETVIRLLTSIRGIGTWTAKMCLLFVFSRPDILPYEDGAFLQTYRWLYKTDDCSVNSIKKKCKKWSPYSSIASRYFYKALDCGLTKTEFHLFKEASNHGNC